MASYLRLVPQHWAGAYRCWGLENREAALRMVTGSAGSEDWAANLEVKCVDLHANPYLLLAGLLAAGVAGIDAGPPCPSRSTSTPPRWATTTRRAAGSTGCRTTLRRVARRVLADEVLTGGAGPALVEAISAVRESEIELFAGASPEEVAAATRWAH